jgi:phenylalanine ammonia-lyase
MQSFTRVYAICVLISVRSSLALISARATINSLEVLSLLTASYLYALCQALDLRALQAEFAAGLNAIIREEFEVHFASYLAKNEISSVRSKVMKAMHDALDSTSTMDASDRMQTVAASSSTILVDFFAGPAFASSSSAGAALVAIPKFRTQIASRATTLLQTLRTDYLSGARGAAPASGVLNKTRPVYEFVRLTLGIQMHGSENLKRFENGPGVDEQTIGQNVSLIHEVGFSFTVFFFVIAESFLPLIL